METWKRALMLIITVTITTWFEIEGCKFKETQLRSFEQMVCNPLTDCRDGIGYGDESLFYIKRQRRVTTHHSFKDGSKTGRTVQGCTIAL